MDNDMEKINTYGLTAYWELNKNDADTSMQKDLQKHFQFFKSIAELNTMTADNSEFVNMVKKELFDQMIHVYTTEGNVIELPNGSTPIDFAYKLHTEIGNTMIGVIVNDEVVNMDYRLQNKDRVRILTDSRSSGPRLDWQDKAKTMRAKRLIREFDKKFRN